MIFTACPYCDESQAFGWDPGQPGGYVPSRCYACRRVMWVELSVCGITRTHEEFVAEVMQPGDEEAVAEAARNAKNLSGMGLPHPRTVSERFAVLADR